MYYDWLSDALKQEFESLKLLKESEPRHGNADPAPCLGQKIYSAPLFREMEKFTSGS